MNEYENNSSMQNTSVQFTGETTDITNHEENIENMLVELIDIERKKLKHIKSLRSYGAIVALVAGIQLIGWILSLMGVIRLFS